MAFAALRHNLARVREEIARLRAREGLDGGVTIVAVTKGHPPAAVRAALEAGLEHIGESRVQEAVAKQDALTGLPVHWHLVGHLQTNKAKYVPDRFALVHSVDSVRLAEALDKALATRGQERRLAVLLQVNVAGEAQKFGCPLAEAETVARRVCALPRLGLRGLMTMAPFTDDERVQRRVFSGLRRLREELEGKGFSLPELSMGMSNDYQAAVVEGATMVRLGTVLFGERPQ